ncbi:MAG: hypothetical protein ACFFB2_09905 [Promethearchaeota archaeon]
MTDSNAEEGLGNVYFLLFFAIILFTISMGVIYVGIWVFYTLYIRYMQTLPETAHWMIPPLLDPEYVTLFFTPETIAIELLCGAFAMYGGAKIIQQMKMNERHPGNSQGISWMIIKYSFLIFVTLLVFYLHWLPAGYDPDDHMEMGDIIRYLWFIDPRDFPKWFGSSSTRPPYLLQASFIYPLRVLSIVVVFVMPVYFLILGSVLYDNALTPRLFRERLFPLFVSQVAVFSFLLMVLNQISWKAPTVIYPPMSWASELDHLHPLTTSLCFFWVDLFALLFFGSIFYRIHLVKKGQLADPDSFHSLNLVITILLLPLGIGLSLMVNFLLSTLFGQVSLLIPFLIRIMITGGILVLILREKSPLRRFHYSKFF